MRSVGVVPTFVAGVPIAPVAIEILPMVAPLLFGGNGARVSDRSTANKAPPAATASKITNNPLCNECIATLLRVQC